MLLHAFGHEPVAFVHAVAVGGAVKIPVAQKRNRAYHEFGLAACPAQQKGFLFGRTRPARHVNVHARKQPGRSVEKGRRIMIARNDHHMPARAPACRNIAQKVVVQLLRRIAGNRTVEHVACNDQRFHPLVPNQIHKPREKTTELLVPPPPVKMMP